MVAANSPGAVLASGGKRIGMSLAGLDGRGAVSLAGRVILALVLAIGGWIVSMLAAATMGRLVLELAQWVGMLVLAVLGSRVQVPLSMMPHALAQLTAVWPTFHLGQFARYALGNGGVDLLPHVVSLLGIAGLFLVIARRVLWNLH